mgnify:CR=1 FL=1
MANYFNNRLKNNNELEFNLNGGLNPFNNSHLNGHLNHNHLNNFHAHHHHNHQQNIGHHLLFNSGGNQNHMSFADQDQGSTSSSSYSSQTSPDIYSKCSSVNNDNPKLKTTSNGPIQQMHHSLNHQLQAQHAHLSQLYQMNSDDELQQSNAISNSSSDIGNNNSYTTAQNVNNNEHMTNAQNSSAQMRSFMSANSGTTSSSAVTSNGSTSNLEDDTSNLIDQTAQTNFLLQQQQTFKSNLNGYVSSNQLNLQQSNNLIQQQEQMTAQQILQPQQKIQQPTSQLLAFAASSPYGNQNSSSSSGFTSTLGSNSSNNNLVADFSVKIPSFNNRTSNVFSLVSNFCANHDSNLSPKIYSIIF